MVTCKEIVLEYLKANGFTGLVATDASCGCSIEDFNPCGEFIYDCEPGYRRECSTCEIKDEGDGCICEEGQGDGCTSKIRPPAKTKEGAGTSDNLLQAATCPICPEWVHKGHPCAWQHTFSCDGEPCKSIRKQAAL